MARYFEATLMGQISFFIAVLSFVILAGSLNFEASLTYFSADNKQPVHQLVSLGLTWIIIYCLGCWYLGQWLAEKYLGGFATGVFAIFSFLYLAGFILINYYNALFFGKKNFTAPHLVATIFNLLLAAAIIALYSAGGKHYLVTYYLPLHLSIFILQGIVMAIWFHTKYSVSLRFSWPGKGAMKIILRYTGYMLLTNLLLFLLYRIDYLMLRYLNETERQLYDLGNYIQVSKLAHIFLLLSSTAGSVVFSTSASGYNSAEGLGKLMRGMLYLGGASFLLILLLGSFLFTWMYGESFNFMYPCLLLVMPGVIALMLVSVTANYLSGIGKPQYNLRGVMLGLTIMIAGDYFLIPVWGIYAAALMCSIAYIVYSVYMLVHFSKTTGFAWHSLFRGGKSDWKYFQTMWNVFVSKK